MTEIFPEGSPEAAIIGAIVGGVCAWTTDLDLVRSVGDAMLHHEVPALAAAGWLCRWDRDALGSVLDSVSWTLTPWAAEQLGVELDERPITEVPYWVEAGKAVGPIVQLGEERAVRLRYPERVPDPHPGPEFLADLETGETTGDPTEAFLFFAGPAGPDLDPEGPPLKGGLGATRGVPVAVDRRAARRAAKASDTDRRRTARKPGKPTPGRSTPK